ncbi:MAG: hypothetical protein HeimC3_52360 [Candidatus Heimdallarchaeota archaeon LC_3]|nr:MAG: hypothetical protein HeimC3_52360 [Candidatus Heimdallarchaeota archaeon LC_3]
MMKEGLESRGLLVESLTERFEEIAEIFQRLVAISIKELENSPLTNEDIQFIDQAGAIISMLANFNDHEFSKYIGEEDSRMAIVADIYTDPNSNSVLEVATGNPFRIWVVVSDHQGKLRLTVGSTYSYYEFYQDASDRLTDEEWHIMLDQGSPILPG